MGNQFERQLTELHNLLIEMGGRIESAITTAINALMMLDVALARQAIEQDDIIDNMEKEIESLCMRLLLLQQPVARDLRLISAALKMITDMERIGDQSADISEITILLVDGPPVEQLDEIREMANAAIKMTNEAIDAFVQRDLEKTRAVMAQDDIVDEYYLRIRRNLIELIKQDVGYCEQAFDLMTIVKYLERIGDHAVNLAEWVEFSLTGIHKRDKII